LWYIDFYVEAFVTLQGTAERCPPPKKNRELGLAGVRAYDQKKGSKLYEIADA
jgi:hypothetical protein